MVKSIARNNMKVSYDKKVDAANIQFFDGAIEEPDEVSEDIIFDFTSDQRLVGIEILDVSKKFPIETLYKFEIDRGSVEE